MNEFISVLNAHTLLAIFSGCVLTGIGIILYEYYARKRFIKQLNEEFRELEEEFGKACAEKLKDLEKLGEALASTLSDRIGKNKK